MEERNIEDLDLSVRAHNCLKRRGINTLSDILERNIEDLMKIRNLNKRCLDEIVQEVNKLGFEIKNQGLYYRK